MMLYIEANRICEDIWIVYAFEQSTEIGLHTMNKDIFGTNKYANLISWDEEVDDEDIQPL